MEETAETIAALHPAVRPRGYLGRFAWSALPETLVRSSLVIVLDELVQHSRKMMPPEDPQVVERLVAYCPHLSFRE